MLKIWSANISSADESAENAKIILAPTKNLIY
jgi:hypothetical protein